VKMGLMGHNILAGAENTSELGKLRDLGEGRVG
jgi:hypothetical protein